jgi:hypothetical protein
MSRGQRSGRALEAAVPVAHMRGEVMFLERRPGTCFDLLTSGPAGTSAIRVERALRIHGSLAEIAAGYTVTLARISAAALAPGIARELWLWSPWGTMRYFRVENEAITELDRLGVVRVPLAKGSLAGAMRPRWRKSRKKSGGPSPGPGSEQPPAAGDPLPPVPGPGQSPGKGSGPPLVRSQAPVGDDQREPAPVRYLRRRAREKSQVGKPAGGGDPGMGRVSP